MRRYFKLLSIKLRIWHYRRWYYKRIEKLEIEPSSDPYNAELKANILFQARFGCGYSTALRLLYQAADELRYGSCPQQQAQPETEQESQT